MTLRARWLGRVRYEDAHALQRALWERSSDHHLLLLEHPHVYTLGVRGDPAHVLVDPSSVGASLVRTDRGGDVTYHGPGQLVGYPIVSVPTGPDSTPSYVHAVEQLVIDVLADVGLPGAGRLEGYPGVWVDGARKICAIGVRVSRGRSMHGFALNVAPDLSMFSHIVPCGIPDKEVTSLAAEGLGDVTMRQVVDAVVARAAATWGGADATLDRADVAWHVRPEDLSPFSRGEGAGGTPVRLLGRLASAGVDPASSVGLADRKPEWMRVKAQMGPEFLDLKRTMRSSSLVTVCEEAGCPNIFECWSDGTATFMINGERCTRACGFCLVDTRLPGPLDPSEPARVAEAVRSMGLSHAVVTAVARDDLPDGGAAAFAATISAVRSAVPGCAVEVLIPDCKGSAIALRTIFDARPDVLNHNIETVPRLQRAVRPSASYARSLSVLARAASAGLVVKSGLIVGMGETMEEVVSVLADLRAVGVSIVTVGQYLRPTAHHLPVARWWTPEEFESLRLVGEALGLEHVQASPLTRSSYHAREAAAGHRSSGPATRAPA
ncbi:MAG TPA: lipoyl synthase [Acidimicrobiales bacterium]|nr:lipoyl synthase [Acidimicrobiales bacterium]